MDNNVSRVAANANFHIQNNALKNNKNDKKPEEQQAQAQTQSTQAKDPDAIFQAMQLNAMQNKALAFGKFVNPKDYLSEDRIKDIEASMGGFEAQNEQTLNAFNEEFKGVSSWENLSEAQKLSIAASANNI